MPVILVVEDDPDILETASMLLSLEGYQVIGARSAFEGLDIMHARNDIDVLFTDIGLHQDMDGLAMVDIVQRRHRRVSIVVASGRSEGETLSHAPPRHPVRFLPKPYGRHQLLAAIRACS